MKVSIFNRKLMKLYGGIIALLSTIISFIQIFYEIPDDCSTKIIAAVCFILLLVILYIIVFIYSNKRKTVKLEINHTTINVMTGDIFNQEGLKVIPFNEYFDTVVDDMLISSNTLNGKYLLNCVDNVKELDEKISADKRLRNLSTLTDNKRVCGKATKYPLGTIFKNKDYLLLAFSKFDSDNRAFLSKNDIISCLLNMWNEIDILYAGHSINIPLLGSGITRFRDVTLSDQELLEILIISYKLSGVQLKNHANINIVIYKDNIDDINFFKLSDYL